MSHQSKSLASRIFLGQTLHTLTLVTGIGIVLGCSSNDGTGSTLGIGGSGGKAGGTGGATSSATGGSAVQSSSTGGASTGGTSATTASTGGSGTTGGASTTTALNTGGSATGGAATGGAATGGDTAAGGSSAATGGKSSVGGTSSSLTGGSSGTGGAATGGTSAGGTTSSPVTPQMVTATDYKLTVGSLVIDINPQVGARVSQLKYSTTDIIKPYTCATYNANDACNNSGSTFWTSPQSAWDGVVGGSNVWPPVAAIDGNPYTAAINGTHLVLTGSADSTLGASVTKDISADSGTGWITLTYTINATKAIQVAPWQITRVARGGLIFWPGTTITATPNTTWKTTAAGGYEWIDDSTQTTVLSSDGSKIVADGGAAGQANTWLANALGGYLFLIKYPNIGASGTTNGAAPNEADTEVYPGQPGNTGYIELEAQGAYTSLAAAAKSTWTVQWRVVPIPSSVTVSAGSTTLITFAEQQAAL